MADFVLFTDSNCDLPNDLAQEMELVVLPLTVSLDDTIYYNYLDEREITYKDFYQRLPSIKTTRTAAANQHEFAEYMEPLLQSGKDVLYLGFSSGLSTTYNNARMAADELREKYPERKIMTVDTLCSSLGQGLLIWHAWQLKKAGKTIDEVVAWLEENKLHLAHWFTVDDLMHLKRGGRVSAATAIVGSMLSIKPVMHVDNEGHLIAVGKARGRKASIKALVEQTKKLAIKPEEQTMFICHGDCLEDAEYFADLLRKELHVKEIIIGYIGPVIGSHSGPGTLAVFFLATER